VKRLILVAASVGALAACAETLSGEARQYIEQQARASADSMTIGPTGAKRFEVLSVDIDEVGRDGSCGTVQTDRGPIPFVALSNEVGGRMIMGPAPLIPQRYFQSTIEYARERHLELVAESASKVGCELSVTA